MNCTLLTGATGFLGANVLHDLLMRTPTDVRCLVRAESSDAGRARLRAALGAQGLWRDELAGRIQVEAGDLSQPNLGLSDGRLKALGEDVDTIVHTAARVNLALPYRTLRAPNVLGTRQLLQLACRGCARKFHFVSSIASVRAKARGHAAVSGYAVTKWVGERLVRAAALRGLPSAIFRPGRISAHSETGAYNPQDLFALLVAACVRLDAAPRFDGTVHLTPVDVVSREIVERAGDALPRSRVFHVVNPIAVAWADVIRALLARHAIAGCMPYPAWRQRLHRAAANDGEPGLKMLDLVLSDTRPPLPPRSVEAAFARAKRLPREGHALHNAELRALGRYVDRILMDVNV